MATLRAMRHLSVDRNRCTFEVHGEAAVGMANALRRALMSDVVNYAAKEVVIRTNTSCQTDEYIAHRVGMIPVRRRHPDVDGAMTLCVSGREALASDMKGDAYYAPQDVPIIKMLDGQTLDLDVVFGAGTGADHVKFSHIGPVAYSVESETRVRMGFEMITDESPLDYVERAVQMLERRVDDAIFAVETKTNVK